ncbi:MAG TPA: hypothetical protein VLA04_02905 [Verrucomicrobiae bacterium]|nr:hypothetical protein [Verrucomicrobiae bacterium]
MPPSRLTPILRLVSVFFSLLFIIVIAIIAREAVVKRQATVRLEDNIPSELRSLTWKRGFTDCYGTADNRSSCPVLSAQVIEGTPEAEAAQRIQQSLSLKNDSTDSHVLADEANFLYLFSTDISGSKRSLRLMEYDLIPCRTHSCGLLP